MVVGNENVPEIVKRHIHKYQLARNPLSTIDDIGYIINQRLPGSGSVHGFLNLLPRHQGL